VNSPDYRPAPDEVGDFEILFGDLLCCGHSVQEAADFLRQLGNRVEP
jgi:hypothetical protein